MIIAFIGNVGSGKTVSMVKSIVDYKGVAYTNFNLKDCDYTRLKFEDLIILKNEKKDVNWKKWDEIRGKHKYFSIFLDEVDELINARASMTKRNMLLSRWVAQIRKILKDNPDNHLFISTQTPRKIDVNFRDLTHIVVRCKKIEKGNKVFIVQDYYEGFDDWNNGVKSAKKYFLANKYFKYYDTNEMVYFEDAEKYL